MQHLAKGLNCFLSMSPFRRFLFSWWCCRFRFRWHYPWRTYPWVAHLLIEALNEVHTGSFDRVKKRKILVLLFDDCQDAVPGESSKSSKFDVPLHFVVGADLLGCGQRAFNHDHLGLHVRWHCFPDVCAKESLIRNGVQCFQNTLVDLNPGI